MPQALKVKVRFPPSPTGNLHVGNAMTMIFNWLFAKKNMGEIVMRLEDTDTERSTKEFEGDILNSLRWLELDWDGPIYRQSERAEIYKKHLQKLLAEDKAFWCHHTKEELEAESKQQMEAKQPPRHVCGHRHDKAKQIKQNGVIRLAVDADSDRVISFEDKIRGRIEFKESLLGNFSIARNLDSALYHFTVSVDDGEMGITHIIRGEDHISNTPKQILIYEALSMPLPEFAHLPLLLGADKSKLSKRHGSTAVSAYKEDYLPEALFNFLAGMSCTFSKDIMTKEEMVNEFDLAKVHKSGAIFDVKKLNWLNSQYIRGMKASEFVRRAGLEDKQLSDAAVAIITERLERLTEIDQFAYLWSGPVYETNLLKWKNGTLEKAKAALLEAKILFTDSELIENELKLKLDKLAERLSEPGNIDRGVAYWPLRVALSGKEKSADPIAISLAIGQVETLKRINSALHKLG